MIYERIKKLCEEKQLTVRRLEIDCGLSNGSIVKWKTAQPAAASLYKVAKRLDVSVEELLEAE